MAMTNCPECKKNVSSEASSCPNCGYDFSKAAKTKQEQVVGVIIVLLILAGLLFYFLNRGDKPHSPSSSNTGKTTESTNVDSPSINAPFVGIDKANVLNEYIADINKAVNNQTSINVDAFWNDKYEGKYVVTEVKVNNVKQEGTAIRIVGFSEEGVGTGVNVYLNQQFDQYAGQLSKGSMIRVIGRLEGRYGNLLIGRTIKDARIIVDKAINSNSNAAPPSIQAEAQTPNNPSANNCQPSFDCAKASTPVEKAICGNSELSCLDFEMSQEYSQIRKIESSETFAELKNSQIAWIKNRETILSNNGIQGLIDSFKGRILELSTHLKTLQMSNPESYIIGCWFQPHSAENKIQFLQNMTYNAHLWSTNENNFISYSGKYKFVNDSVVLYDNPNSGGYSIHYYRGEAGDNNYYLKNEDWYFVHSGSNSCN